MDSIIGIIKEIPHGHGASVKKGVSDAILNREEFKNKIPNGHDLSYDKGLKLGKFLENILANEVKK